MYMYVDADLSFQNYYFTHYYCWLHKTGGKETIEKQVWKQSDINRNILNIERILIYITNRKYVSSTHAYNVNCCYILCVENYNQRDKINCS